MEHPVSLNLRVRGLEHSATLAINQRSSELQALGREIHRLGLGQSPFPVPPSVIASLREHAEVKDYLDVRGLGSLRDSVARFHQRRDGVSISAEQVLVGPGSKELLFLLQLAFYGDILVPTPCWVSYTPQARILGRKVRTIPTRFEDRWQLTPEHFARICDSDRDRHRPRLLVLNYPANPHGLSYTEDELQGLADVARHYGVILLSDEIYGELRFDGDHRSVARYYPEGTIISSGLSKWCGAGGWRLGTFSFPAELRTLRESMTSVASETFTSVSAPIQYAAITAFDFGPEIEGYVSSARDILARLADFCFRRLSNAGIRIHPCEGGFYLFLDFGPIQDALRDRNINDSDTLCERLLEETGVATLPGRRFERPDDELSLRMAFVDFDGEAAMQALAQLGEGGLPADLASPVNEGFVRTHCASVCTAMDKIESWVHEMTSATTGPSRRDVAA